jgi:hypothetical protein
MSRGSSSNLRMIASIDPKTNHLLAALPEAEWQCWLPQLELVEMPRAQVFYESGATLTHVDFLTTAIVSLVYVLAGGASAEIAIVGNEGLVGISLFMGRVRGSCSVCSLAHFGVHQTSHWCECAGSTSLDSKAERPSAAGKWGGSPVLA